GALVVVHPDVAKSIKRQSAKVLGHAEAPKHTDNGRLDLTYTGAVFSGPRAFAEAGVTPADIDYASIYDSFTITVLETIEDLGFCAKGDGGRFVLDGALVAPDGREHFDGLEAGMLLLPRCDRCGTVIWYPRHLCPACGSLEVSWFEAGGRGTLHSFSVIRRGQGAYAEATPYVLAYVELEEG